jgi:hypothetical protein
MESPDGVLDPASLPRRVDITEESRDGQLIVERVLGARLKLANLWKRSPTSSELRIVSSHRKTSLNWRRT